MIEVPFDPIFPYDFGAAGNINSTMEDMARWMRLQLGDGTFEGRPIVSPEILLSPARRKWYKVHPTVIAQWKRQLDARWRSSIETGGARVERGVVDEVVVRGDWVQLLKDTVARR